MTKKGYTREETKVIESVKQYLKAIRALKIERFNLNLELENIPTPQSPVFSDEPKGNSGRTKVEQLDSYIMRRELLIKRMALFDEELNKFTPYTYLLNTGQRNIINAYVNNRGYAEMIEMLSGVYYISETKYRYEINNICLTLSKYIDYNNPPLISEINYKYKMLLSSM